MVRIPSISLKEGTFADYLIEHLKSLHFEVVVDNANRNFDGEVGNIIAFKKGSKNAGIYAFAAHMDTVVPGENVKPIVDNGIIRSDGNTILGADDKAGIAAILEAVTTIVEKDIPHASFYVIFTVAEEIGLLGTKYIELSKYNIDGVFCFDSGKDVGDVIIRGPAQKSIIAKFIGRSAHAGSNPEDGINSILAASKAISSMRLGRIDYDTTANIGIIKGGNARNIVPEETIVHGEVRSRLLEKLKMQTSHMIEAFKKGAKDTNAQVDIDVKNEYKAFSIPSDHKLILLLKRAFETLNIEVNLTETGGGSDANVFNEKGIPSVNIGMGMKRVHTKDEYIAKSDLYIISNMIYNLITGII